jgi:hypothetical protein
MTEQVDGRLRVLHNCRASRAMQPAYVATWWGMPCMFWQFKHEAQEQRSATYNVLLVAVPQIPRNTIPFKAHIPKPRPEAASVWQNHKTQLIVG